MLLAGLKTRPYTTGKGHAPVSARFCANFVCFLDAPLFSSGDLSPAAVGH